MAGQLKKTCVHLLAKLQRIGHRICLMHNFMEDIFGESQPVRVSKS